MSNLILHHAPVSSQVKSQLELFRYRLESKTYRVIEVTANEAAIAPLLRMGWVVLAKSALVKEVA